MRLLITMFCILILSGCEQINQSVIDDALNTETKRTLVNDPLILENLCLGQSVSSDTIKLNACKKYLLTFLKFIGETHDPYMEEGEDWACYPSSMMDRLIAHGLRHGYIIPSKFKEALERSGL